MSNVLSDEKRQQILALGRLAWPLRRIEQATGVRRETAGAYLKAAGIYVRLGTASAGKTGQRGDHRLWPGKPVNEAVTESHFPKPVNEVTTDSGSSELLPDSPGLSSEPEKARKYLFD